MAETASNTTTFQGTPIRLYEADLKAVPSDMSELLASYSGIPPAEQKDHILRVRDRAYATHPYPCLGRWRFLELDLSSHPLYKTDVLGPLVPSDKNKSTTDSWLFLDLGCCLGQDVRKLIHDGADRERVRGADLKPEFIEMGYELFNDPDTLPRQKHFVSPADVFDQSPSANLAVCDGKVGILHASAVFHLFDLPGQKRMARRCLKLLDQRRGRVLLCGAQVGNVDPGEAPRVTTKGTRYRHDGDSWRRMWEEVVREDDVWAANIRNVDVGCEMEEWVGRNEMETKGLVGDDGQAPGEGLKKRQIGRVEDGFRWMRWWVWIDFV
ncbi:hypothetical protein H2204_003880 [Knufia peltigerae]|uniref:Methyltransferase domain-containing protein n=1 Tax=Knufia peltigerae TaxID=1002370 RepID=A0AA38Y8J9_9EURO|nr:hypothetical protein H2204_003880 [Knufia peltigerae]